MKAIHQNTSESGNVLFLILIALLLFVGLSYAVTSSSRTGSQNVQTEKENVERAVGHSCETQLNTALTRLRVYKGCTSDQISYELPDGSNSNPLAPSDKSCHVYHVNGAGASPCNRNEALVEWTNGVGVSIDGNTVTKTDVTVWGNGGMSSVQRLPANTDGYAKTTLTGNKVFFGLSNTDQSASWNTVAYGIHSEGGGVLEPFVSGSKKSAYNSTWSVGDIVEVSRTAGVISYKKNGVVFYTAPGTYNGSLIVDVAIYYQNREVSNTYVSEGFE